MEQIDTLKKIIFQYCTLSGKVLDETKKVSRTDNIELYLNRLFLERLFYSSKALLPLIELLEQDRKFKLPICLILRTALSDLLMFYYFADFKANNDLLKLKDEFYEIMAFDLKYLVGPLSKKNDFKHVIKMLKNQFPDFFLENSDEIIKSKKLKPSEISGLIKSENSHVNNIYKIYSLYSKYEHISVFTNELQKDEEFNKDFDYKGIIMAVIYISYAIDDIFEALNYSEIYKSEFQIIENHRNSLL